MIFEEKYPKIQSTLIHQTST